MNEVYFDPILGRLREKEIVPTGGGGGSTTTSSSGSASPLEAKDEGSSLTLTTASLNFAGSGVTATTSGNDVTVTVPGGYTPGGTDVAVADGGTGSSTASGARTNLGLAIGTDVVAPNQDTTGKSAKTDALNSATTVVNVAAATAPTTGQVLTATDSTHATWQTVSGGQTLVTKVVAASGGDYTTLGAALTAASDGWTIFVKPGTYTESAITITTTGVTIIGAGHRDSIIQSGSTNFSMTGAQCTITGLGFEPTTGTITFTGNRTMLTDCRMEWGGNVAGTYLLLGGGSTRVRNNHFKCGTTSSSAACRIDSFNDMEISGNYFDVPFRNSSNGYNAVHFDGVRHRIYGNFFDCSNGGSAGSSNSFVYLECTESVFSGNTVKGGNGTGQIQIDMQGGDNAVIGNVCDTYKIGINVTGNYGVVSGNHFIGNNMTSSIKVQGAGAAVSGNVGRSNGAGTGIQVLGSNCSIGNNTLNTYAIGIDISADNNAVTANNIQNMATTAIYLNGNNSTANANMIYGNGTPAGTGIKVESAMDNCVITGNRVMNHVTGVLINASTCDKTVLVGNSILNNTTNLTDSGTATVNSGNITA